MGRLMGAARAELFTAEDAESAEDCDFLLLIGAGEAFGGIS